MASINLNFDLTIYYLSLFRICHNEYEMGNYISCVYNSRKPVVHEGTKCNLMTDNGCCHSSYPLLSKDISMTEHRITIFVLLMWMLKFVSCVTPRTEGYSCLRIGY